MPRSVGRYRRLCCHSCSREWSAVVWSYSDDFPDERRNAITCTCDHPHVELLPSLSDAIYATCRREQRAVVYIGPDGKVYTPFTNSYTDEVAIEAVSQGAYRYEFDSVRSLRRFHEDHRRFAIDEDGNRVDVPDEFSERSRVLDWDQHSIATGNFGSTDPVRTGIRNQHAAAIRRSVAAERRYPSDYYDQVLAKHKARTGA